MPVSLGAFHDPGLTNRVNTLFLPERLDGNTGPQDIRLYIGSPVSGWQFRAATDPGVDPILFGVTASGDQPASAVRIAGSQAGLSAATPGAPVILGEVIESGPGRGVEVWVRVQSTGLTAGTYSGLALETTEIDVSPVGSGSGA